MRAWHCPCTKSNADMKTNKMKKKINTKFMLIAAIAIVVTAVSSILLFYRILETQIYDDLKANAHIIAMAKPGVFAGEAAYDLKQDGIRMTYISGDGSVLFDSVEEASSMENHKDRTEVAEAFERGEGTDIRRSLTSGKHTFYFALRLPDGSVLRIARESGSVSSLLRTMAGLSMLVCALIFVMCAFYSHRLTGRLVAPVEKLADNIVMINETEVYEEIRPFIATIKQQHMDILNHARVRQEFTANVSHELKTPLTAISGYAELIANGITEGEDTLHFAREIHNNAERLQSLIEDIIRLSELDDTDRKQEFQPVDLYELGEQCIAAMALQAKKNEVSMRLVGEHIRVRGNRTLLEELVFNLCSNAVRYNKRGGSVTVCVGTEQNRPVLTVEDTGIGIPKEHQDRVFERFYRVDKSRSKSTGGTGLGLAIVKHIVAQHEAQISLKSEEGVGTEIKVYF